MIYDSVECLIGHTPLFEPKRLSSALGLKGRLLLKLESFNPAGSAKDRAALFMINDAEETGRLSPGGTIIEPTSGNTGIALSAIGAARGYRIIIVMPDTMSEERRSMMKAYGAELVLTDGRTSRKRKSFRRQSRVPSSQGSSAIRRMQRLITEPQDQRYGRMPVAMSISSLQV